MKKKARIPRPRELKTLCGQWEKNTPIPKVIVASDFQWIQGQVAVRFEGLTGGQQAEIDDIAADIQHEILKNKNIAMEKAYWIALIYNQITKRYREAQIVKTVALDKVPPNCFVKEEQELDEGLEDWAAVAKLSLSSYPCIRAMYRHNGNVTHAAKSVGKNRRTFRRHLEKERKLWAQTEKPPPNH